MFCAVGALVISQLGGCGETPPPTGAGEELPRALVRTAASGTVTLRFTVAPGDLSYQEKATVLVEVEAEAGTTVTVDNYSDAIRRSDHQFELSAREIGRKEAILQADGRLSWSYRYELSFVLPGEYELPGATVSSLLASASADSESETRTVVPAGEVTSLSTEGVTVIAEATESAAMTAEQLAEIEVLPPVEMKEEVSAWIWVLPLLAIVLIGLVVFFLRRRRRSRPEVVIVIPAHEWADQALAQLVAEELAKRGLIQEFHYRISDILRGYIERRYAVLAREMTTEEFLAAATHDARFDGSANGELDQFLRACDLVKYAKHQATVADGEALLKTTRAYVARTRERLVAIAGDNGSDEGGTG